jgi:Icc-related predicted phosphoesterase
MFNELFGLISTKADVLVLGGDLTDLGLPQQAEVLAVELRSLSIPVVGVLGNHDYQSDQEQDVKDILRRAGMFILDTEPTVIHEVGFAGTKGFGGGFEKYTLGSFGEPGIK